MSDFTDDLNRRILQTMVGLGITPQTAEMVAAELVMDMRRDWAGERPFIGANAPDARKLARNCEIIRAFRQGESTGELARRYGMSRQRIHQIING